MFQEGELLTLPLLLDNYTPQFEGTRAPFTPAQAITCKCMYEPSFLELSSFPLFVAVCGVRYLDTSITGLPLFVLRLATEVNWESEQECFESLAKEIGLFYALNPNWIASDDDTSNMSSPDATTSSGQPSWRWTVEHVIYPALKATLLPSQATAQDSSILQIANLHDLYKVFERC